MVKNEPDFDDQHEPRFLKIVSLYSMVRFCCYIHVIRKATVHSDVFLNACSIMAGA